MSVSGGSVGGAGDEAAALHWGQASHDSRSIGLPHRAGAAENPKLETRCRQASAGRPRQPAKDTSGTIQLQTQRNGPCCGPCCACLLTWARHRARSPHGRPVASVSLNSACIYPAWTLGCSGRSGSARTGRGRSWARRPRAPPSRETLPATPTAQMTTAVRRRGAAAAWVCRCVGDVGDAGPGLRCSRAGGPGSPDTAAAARQGCGTLRRPAICGAGFTPCPGPSSPACGGPPGPSKGLWQPVRPPHGSPGRPCACSLPRARTSRPQPGRPANSRQRA